MEIDSNGTYVQDTALETMQKFESGMCLTLKNAWLHSEAVQVLVILEYSIVRFS
jgi:hypothetical protein